MDNRRSKSDLLLCRSDNFELYAYKSFHADGVSYDFETGRYENDWRKEHSKIIERKGKVLNYCIYLEFVNNAIKVKFKIALRRDSIQSLKSYSECLKDTVKFAKEASRIIHNENPQFKII